MFGKLAAFDREFLIPSIACQACQLMELHYDAGFAMQSRILTVLRLYEGDFFKFEITHFWTPCSGRAYLPSATAVFGVDLQERDFLGGWTAQGSDRYARVATRRTVRMQRLVSWAIHCVYVGATSTWRPKKSTQQKDSDALICLKKVLDHD